MRAKTLLLASLPTVALLLAPACKGPKITNKQSNAELSEAVAKVDDQAISVGDLQDRINKQSPFIRSRYTSAEKKKEFLDSIVRFEVMAKEAMRRGYDKDPDVIRSMKQQMISKFMQKEFDAKLKVEDVPDAEVEKYYKEHPEEFNKKDEVRVSQVMVADEAKAKKVHEEAKKAPKQDQKAFRDLVEKYSEDLDSKSRGGDMTFFDRDSSMFPKEFKEAAFNLSDIGDVTPPLKSTKGFHILKLTQRRPGFDKPLAEVKKQIQQRVFRDYRQKAMDDFVADMKKHIKVEIYEDKLGKVLVDTGLTGGGSKPGGAPGSGMSGAPAPGAPGASVPAVPAPAHPVAATNPAKPPAAQ